MDQSLVHLLSRDQLASVACLFGLFGGNLPARTCLDCGGEEYAEHHAPYTDERTPYCRIHYLSASCELLLGERTRLPDLRLIAVRRTVVA